MNTRRHKLLDIIIFHLDPPPTPKLSYFNPRSVANEKKKSREVKQKETGKGGGGEEKGVYYTDRDKEVT